jgi:hypothetical protein
MFFFLLADVVLLQLFYVVFARKATVIWGDWTSKAMMKSDQATMVYREKSALNNMFYTTAITPPTLAQPDSSSDPITASSTIAGSTLEYSITSANGATTTTGSAESLGTATSIPAPADNWQNGMKVKARNSDAQTGQNSSWSAVLTIALS